MKRGWLAICDRCGFKYHSYELKKEWQGLMVCHTCWEPRHPQDFVKSKPENVSVPWTRPEPTDEFVQICYIHQQSAFAGMGTAGCMIAGKVIPNAAFLRDFLGV